MCPFHTFGKMIVSAKTQLFGLSVYRGTEPTVMVTLNM